MPRGCAGASTGAFQGLISFPALGQLVGSHVYMWGADVAVYSVPCLSFHLWSACLQGTSGRPETLTAPPVEGRPRSELEGLKCQGHLRVTLLQIVLAEQQRILRLDFH